MASKTLPALRTAEDGRTVWTQHRWCIESLSGMQLSPRIGCSSLRLRTSEPGYESTWHVAGDPTLIVVQRGTLRLILRDGQIRDFTVGDAFIAADVVPAGLVFDANLHGHRAEVIGEERLEAIHIKLTGPLG